jgi:hypothetical protein
MRINAIASIAALSLLASGCMGTGMKVVPSSGPVAPQRVVPASSTPAFVQFGTLPLATAGTKLSKTMAIVVQDSSHHTITGTYATPISLLDGDGSAIAQGTAFSLNGGAPARSITIKKSTDVVTLRYGGLAMGPVTFSLSGTGFKAVKAGFAPSLGTVTYTGPLSGNAPEIDLYDPTPGNAGNKATFTLSEAGWNSFGKGFTSARSGSQNVCTGFNVTHDTKAQKFTVAVGGAPVAGKCTLTLTGATATLKRAVLLTFTTSTVGVSSRAR